MNAMDRNEVHKVCVHDQTCKVSAPLSLSTCCCGMEPTAVLGKERDIYIYNIIL